MKKTYNPKSFLENLLDKTLKIGVDEADAVLYENTQMSAAFRLGKKEKIFKSDTRYFSLRVIKNKSQSVVSSSNLSRESVKRTIESAISMSEATPKDPNIGLAKEIEKTKEIKRTLKTYDPAIPTEKQLEERAVTVENAARSVKGITNSEGCIADWEKTKTWLIGSNGFLDHYTQTKHKIFVNVLAKKDGSMERDYEYRSTVFKKDLGDLKKIGISAGEKAIKRLNSRKIKTIKAPIIFDPRVAASVIKNLGDAINGNLISKGISFLNNDLHKLIFSKDISIIDDPMKQKGLKSRPFDTEGIAGKKLDIVKNGELKTWLLDLRTARKLGLKTTGNASRTISTSPEPASTNLYLSPGKLSPKKLIAETNECFYVTELMGTAVNLITGDYSRGACGYWMKNGEIAFPVSEVTIAGNLRNMFKNLSAANDLQFHYGTDAPTIRVEGMIIAGQ